MATFVFDGNLAELASCIGLFFQPFLSAASRVLKGTYYAPFYKM